MQEKFGILNHYLWQNNDIRYFILYYNDSLSAFFISTVSESYDDVHLVLCKSRNLLPLQNGQIKRWSTEIKNIFLTTAVQVLQQ